MTHAVEDIKVLLVEDNDVDAEALRRAFRKAELHNPLIRATTAREALAILRGDEGHPRLRRPFVMLVDLKLPGHSGIELLREVRRDPGLRDTVGFVLTTSRHPDDKAAAYDLHVAGYMVKDNVGQDLARVAQVLQSYWTAVDMPAEVGL